MNENATLLMLSFLSYASNNLTKKKQEALGFFDRYRYFLSRNFGTIRAQFF